MLYKEGNSNYVQLMPTLQPIGVASSLKAEVFLYEYSYKVIIYIYLLYDWTRFNVNRLSWLLLLI